MTEALDLSMFVRRAADGVAHMELVVDGVGCVSCIRKIENGLKAVPGIAGARLNFTDRRLVVDWREDELSAGDVIEAVERIGYQAHPFRPQQFPSHRSVTSERSEMAQVNQQHKWLQSLAVNKAANACSTLFGQLQSERASA